MQLLFHRFGMSFLNREECELISGKFSTATQPRMETWQMSMDPIAFQSAMVISLSQNVCTMKYCEFLHVFLYDSWTCHMIWSTCNNSNGINQVRWRTYEKFIAQRKFNYITWLVQGKLSTPQCQKIRVRVLTGQKQSWSVKIIWLVTGGK
jgi:hypothetical protein